MKQIEIIIPGRVLRDVNDILRDARVGGMTHYRVQGRGATKAEAVAVGRGTMRYTPEYIPRTKVEVVVKDEQVDMLCFCTQNSKFLKNYGGGSTVIEHRSSGRLILRSGIGHSDNIVLKEDGVVVKRIENPCL